MFLSDLSIKRPYFAIMINLAIIIFGLIAFPKLPIADSPNVEFPMLVIYVPYPGASSSTTEELVLKPLEEALKGLSGVKEIRGKAQSALASVEMRFNLEVLGDKALEDVRNIVSNVQFPDKDIKPLIMKMQTNSDPILVLTVTSDKLPPEELSTVIKNNIRSDIQRIVGVSRVEIGGEQDKEIHIELKQNIIKAMNISPLLVRDLIESQMVNVPAGQIQFSNFLANITTYKVPDSIDSLNWIPLRTSDNKFVNLGDVADVRMSQSDENSFAQFNGQKLLSLTVFKESQGNVVKIAQDVLEKINKINLNYKGKLELKVVDDRSVFIKESYRGVMFDLFLGIIFAVLSVFLFLHEWKNTLICAVAIPTSIIGTFAVIKYLNFSLNFMTLFALTLCIGIVIDDAIVVIENIHRHRKMGKNSVQAAREGTKEIGFAAISVTCAIVCVFVPVAFMEGIIGRFFYEFGVTVTVAVLFSLFVAFTLTPMLSSRIVKKNKYKLNEIQEEARPNGKPSVHFRGFRKFFIKFDNYFDRFGQSYTRFISRALTYKKTTVTISLLVFVISIVLLKFVPVMFSAQQDNANAQITFNLEQNTPLNVAIERAKEIDFYIRKIPGVKSDLVNIDTNSGYNALNFTISLVKKEERKFSDTEFLGWLTNDLQQFVRSPKEHAGLAENSWAPIQISLISSKSELLKNYAAKLAQYLNTLPGVKSATSGSADPIYEYRIIPIRTETAAQNINVQDIANTLQLFYGGVKVGKFNDNGQFIDIKMMIPKNNNSSMSDLNGIFIPTQDGNLTLLSSVARIEKVEQSPAIEHLNGENSITVKANYDGKDLGQITKLANEFMNKTMPLDISSELSGDSGDVQVMISTVGVSLLLAVIFVFMVLAVQFGNLLAPCTILLSIPFSFSGAFIALLITGNSLNIVSMIGIIMLMGLVTKNAILLIEFTQQQTQQGVEIKQALISATKVRLRPIIMTTLTMIMGMLPMVFSGGFGSEDRQNIAVTVIGGLISSTVLTLIIVPCAYLIFAQIKFFKRRAAL